MYDFTFQIFVYLHNEDPEDTHTAGPPTPILTSDLPTAPQTTADPRSDTMTTGSPTGPPGETNNLYSLQFFFLRSEE